HLSSRVTMNGRVGSVVSATGCGAASITTSSVGVVGSGTCSGTGAAQGLLTGMTPASFTIPTGWTLVVTEGFETGGLGSANESLNSGFNCCGGSGGSGGIRSGFGHTGTFALFQHYNNDQDGLEW